MVNRSKDMSSRCRRFRTSVMTRNAKLLIAYGCATVAEGRQGKDAASLSNNNHKRRKVNAASRCCAKTRLNRAHEKFHGTVLQYHSCIRQNVSAMGARRKPRFRLTNVLKKDI